MWVVNRGILNSNEYLFRTKCSGKLLLVDRFRCCFRQPVLLVLLFFYYILYFIFPFCKTRVSGLQLLLYLIAEGYLLFCYLCILSRWAL